MAKKGKNGASQYRSAVTGRFVAAHYAKRHPNTTVVENVSITVPPPKRTKPKKKEKVS